MSSPKMISPIKPERIQEFAAGWFRALDAHAPIDQCWSMLSDDQLQMHFPDGDIQHFTFRKWYDRVTNLFFDEKHDIRMLEVHSANEDRADVTVVVGWQASWWQAPAAKREHVNLEATQRWTIRACPMTKNAFGLEICSYIMEDKIEYAPGSARLPPTSDPNTELIAETQANLDGQEMYEMLFRKPAKPLNGLNEFTIKHLFAHVWSRSRPPIDEARMISLRERSMITMSLIAAQGRNEELEDHIRGALNQGISKDQVLEIMIHVGRYAGGPAVINAQRVAMKVFEQQPDSPIDEVRLISSKERSMITASLLTAQGRSEELESHIREALNQGISKDQVLEIMIHVAHYAGWPAGHNGERIAMQVFEQQTDC